MSLLARSSEMMPGGIDETRNCAKAVGSGAIRNHTAMAVMPASVAPRATALIQRRRSALRRFIASGLLDRPGGVPGSRGGGIGSMRPAIGLNSERNGGWLLAGSG